MAGSHTVNLSDTIAQWVTKSNAQDSDIGIRANLTTTRDSNIVSAINSLPDSDNVITLIEDHGIDSALIYDFTIDSGRVKSLFGITGGRFHDTATIDFDSTGPRMNIVSSSITSSLFNSPVTLTIYDSAGSTLKTLRSPGS